MTNPDSPRGQLPRQTRAMILAAGLGTRFKPWTDENPKALAVVNGKTLLQRNVEWLQQYGITEIIVNIHHFPEKIREAVRASGGWGAQISFSDESGEVLETGGGLKKAAWFFPKDPFVLLNADILTDLPLDAMMRSHLGQQPLATLATTSRSSSRCFLFDPAGRLCGWRNNQSGEEKGPILGFSEAARKACMPRAFSGVHIISPAIFPKITREGKFSMVDCYLDLCAREKILSFDHSGSRFVDVGRAESLLQAEKIFP